MNSSLGVRPAWLRHVLPFSTSSRAHSLAQRGRVREGPISSFHGNKKPTPLKVGFRHSVRRVGIEPTT